MKGIGSFKNSPSRANLPAPTVQFYRHDEDEDYKADPKGEELIEVDYDKKFFY